MDSPNTTYYYFQSNIGRKIIVFVFLMVIISFMTWFRWRQDFTWIHLKEKLFLSNTTLLNDQTIVHLNNKVDYFDSMTAFQLMEYLKWPSQKACKRVGYYGGTLLRYDDGLAIMEGQKAICLDDGIAPLVNECLVYSIGINYEWDFDDTMENYGCQVYSFDPTMDEEEHNRTSKIHFFPIGLGDRNEVLELGKGKQIHSMNLYSNRTSFKIMTLSSIYQMLSPMHGEEAIIDYLKIDIEWEEWNVIPELIESGILERVRQMGIEIHLNGLENATLTQLRNDVKILDRLESEGGMVRFDSKGNGQSVVTFKEMDGITDFYAYEMAWYNKKCHE